MPRQLGPLWFGLLFAALSWTPAFMSASKNPLSYIVIVFLFIFSGLQDGLLKRFGYFPGMTLTFILGFSFVWASAYIVVVTRDAFWLGLILYFLLGLTFGLLRSWAIRL